MLEVVFPCTTCFNTQPPEGGCKDSELAHMLLNVSTHSRPKAAGARVGLQCFQTNVSTHSRPKAAAGMAVIDIVKFMFQHTAARRRLSCFL